MNLERVNNSIYVLPKIGSGKDDKWKGKKLLDVRYWVMSILAKRRSGKTTLIFNLIKNFCTKKTIILFFVPTFMKDDTYQAIREYLDEKGNQYLHFGSIKEDGVDNITTFMEANKGDTSHDSEDKEDPKVGETQSQVCNFGDDVGGDVGEKKEKKKQPPPPEYLIIFDDISSELRDKSVSVLCKNSRHFKCKIILSSQSIIDLNPNTHAQVDYCCLFKDFNRDSLEKIYRKLEPNLDYESFEELYHSVTESKMRGHPTLNNFLLLDRANQEYRVNLNDRIRM